MNRSLVVAALAAALAACAVQDTKPSAKADPPYVFPHGPHVENDVDCLLCHASIAKSTALEARVRHVQLKMVDACKDCHDAKDTKFKLPTVPARTREFSVRVDHAAHVARKVACKTCHTALPDVGATRSAPVSMSSCTTCHNHQKDFATARCMPCHVDLKKYAKPVAAFQHQGDFLKIHGALAKPTAETCAQCHEQTFCADCHSGTTVAARPSLIWPEEVQRDFIHRGDFLSRHMIEVEADPASCRKCHGSRFCDSCHSLQNVSADRGPTSRLPHPPGWGTDVNAGNNFHGNQARRNIVVCAGCHDHDGAAVCTTCHGKTGGVVGIGGNPHPSSFLSRFKDSDIAKNAMCQACHR